MPQLRQNPITGHWVVIAPERAKRPSDFVQPKSEPKKKHNDCPFCPTGQAYKDRIQGFESDEIYIAKNKFPAFVEDPKAASPRSFQVENGFYRARPSVGGHDVIVVKDSSVNLPTFPSRIWKELLDSFRSRMIYFRDILGVESSMPIYNYLQAAGASIDHPHAQLFASNIVPNQLAREVHNAYDHFNHHGVCVFCELVKHELQQKVRVIAESEHFVAFTFYAARFPFESWILPKAHADRFENAEASIYEDLSQLLPKVFGMYHTVLNDPPLNFYIHTLPNSLDQADFFHWHMEITPRISTYGGFELGGGMIIDIVSPEHAAEFLRNT